MIIIMVKLNTFLGIEKKFRNPLSYISMKQDYSEIYLKYNSYLLIWLSY